WEIVNTNPNAVENLRFSVFASYVANPAQNSPPPGSMAVNLSYAPAPPLFNAGAGAAASATLPIPRFIADPNAATNLLTIGACIPSGPDIALNMPTSQSSTFPGYPASKANDGNTDGNVGHGSVTVTNSATEANPWWQVDLGASATVNSVVVWNRTDCCGNRLS